MLQQLLAADKSDTGSSKSSKVAPPRSKARPAHTTLILDTNIFFSDTPRWTQLVNQQWKIIVPLAVVTELDGLTRSPTPSTAQAAQCALFEVDTFLASGSVQVQTSRFTYVTDLSVRTEEIDFASIEELGLPRARTLDDVILRLAVWHAHQATDRTGIPSALLVTFDTNLRVKARAYGVFADVPSSLVDIP